MSSIEKCSALSAVVVALAGVASAQSVLVVDPANGSGTDFTSLPTAVAAAADGDVLLLRTGSYNELVIASKSLTVIADRGAVVTISDTLNVEGLTPSQSVALRGLKVVASEQSYAASIENCSGPVWIEDCEFLGSPTTQVSGGIFIANCDGVVFLGSSSQATLRGSSSGRSGLLVIDSNVMAYDCSFDGTDGIETLSNPISGAGGVDVVGGFFFGSGCFFQGGDGGDGVPTLIGCTNGANGGDALRISGNAPTVFLLDNAFNGGAAGAPGKPQCSSGAQGKPLVFPVGSVTPLAGVFRGMTTNSPRREGEIFQETYSAPPGNAVAVAFSFGQVEGVFAPGLLASAHLQPPSFIQLRGIVPGSGTLVKAFEVPLLDPGLEAIVLYMQPIFVAAGKALLGAPSQAVFLDDSL